MRKSKATNWPRDGSNRSVWFRLEIESNYFVITRIEVRGYGWNTNRIKHEGSSAKICGIYVEPVGPCVTKKLRGELDIQRGEYIISRNECESQEVSILKAVNALDQRTTGVRVI
jgi:hypothetical protein